MTQAAKTYQVGEASISWIDELRLATFKFDALYPHGEVQALERYRDRLEAGSFEPGTGTFIQSNHSWLVRTPHHTILIDTATGNDKSRPEIPPLHRLNEPFLTRLAAMAVTPEQVDYVLSPTCMSIISAEKPASSTSAGPKPPECNLCLLRDRAGLWRECRDRHRADRTGPPCLGAAPRKPADRVSNDSVRPAIEAGLAGLIVVDGGEVLEGISFVPTPGHGVITPPSGSSRVARRRFSPET
ncbi:MBL fold metallo-hydrolase [Bradyrhizobium sp. USDA 328]